MTQYFKVGAARCKSMGIPEGTVFPVKSVETNTVGGKGFDAFVILDTGDGWFNDMYIGKDVGMFAVRGEFVDAPKECVQVAVSTGGTKMRKVYEVKNGNKLVKVYRDVENNEYVCNMWEDGYGYPERDYRTDDKKDAIATADVMVGL